MSSYGEEEEDDTPDPNAALFDITIGIILPLLLVLFFEVLYREPLFDMS